MFREGVIEGGLLLLLLLLTFPVHFNSLGYLGVDVHKGVTDITKEDLFSLSAGEIGRELRGCVLEIEMPTSDILEDPHLEEEVARGIPSI